MRVGFKDMHAQSPKAFLRRIGIKEAKYAPDDETYYSALDEIADPAIWESGDAESVEWQDAFFANEKIGKWTLTKDYERLIGILNNSRKIQGLPKSPKRIVDIGGGHGVVALWYASKYPSAEVIVVDRSELALKFGSQLARSSKIDNVKFVKRDFSELANGELGEFDIVLSHHAIRFEINDSSESSQINSYFESTTDPSVVALNAANLLSACVKEKGVCVVSFGLRSYCNFVDFFRASRLANLSVDWRGTCADHEFRDDEFVLKNWVLLLRKGMPNLLSDCLSDTYSIISLGRFSHDPLMLGMSGLPFTSLARDMEPIVFARATYENEAGRPEEIIELKIVNGMLLSSFTSTKGSNRTYLSSAASWPSFFDTYQEWTEKIEQSSAARIVEKYIDSDLQMLVDYYFGLLADEAS